MSDMRGSLQILRIRFISFLQWWKATLIDMLPRVLVELAAGDMRSIRTSSSLEAISLVDHRQGELLKVVWDKSEVKWKPDASWQRISAVMRTRPVELQLTDREILRQEVYLPLAALENLNGAVRHCLSTWSPFSPDDVHVAAIHIASGEQARIEVRYAVREMTDAIVSKATDRGIQVDRIILGHERWCVTISEQIDRIIRQTWVDGCLAASALLLAALVFHTCLMQQSVAIDQVKRVLEHEIRLAQRQDELELAIERTLEIRNSAISEKQTKPSVSQLLASIRNLLPRNAAIARLEIDDKQGLVSIEHSSPSNLVSALVRSPLIKSVQVYQGAVPSLMHFGHPMDEVQTFSFALTLGDQ